MSYQMLIAVLRMPPSTWGDDPLNIQQRHSRYLEAADLIEQWEVLSLVEMSKEIERLRAAIESTCDCPGDEGEGHEEYCNVTQAYKTGPHGTPHE